MSMNNSRETFFQFICYFGKYLPGLTPRLTVSVIVLVKMLTPGRMEDKSIKLKVTSTQPCTFLNWKVWFFFFFLLAVFPVFFQSVSHDWLNTSSHVKTLCVIMVPKLNYYYD